MNNNANNNEEERVLNLIKTLERLASETEKIISSFRPAFGSDNFLTDRDVSNLLKISRRSLQNYRANGIIPFYHIGGKTLYRESELENFLLQHFVK
jgi:hypothetical protein